MKLYIVTLLLLISTMAFSQEKYFFFTLDMNKPMVNTTWIERPSARGFKAGYRAFINPKFSAGLDIGANTFSQYNPTETYQNGNGATTTDFFKYIYSYSATVNGQYNFQVEQGERFFPYVGMGLGANNNEYVVYYNIYRDSERAWGFLARPEAGLLVRIGRSFGLMAAIHYDYSTNRSSKFDYNNFSSVGVQVGVALMDM